MTAEKPVQPGNRALRLTFTYEGADVKLESVQALRAVPPPHDPPPEPADPKQQEAGGASGFWIEVRGVRNRLLYRKAMSSPIKFDMEVHSGERGVPPRQVRVENPSGRFFALVPHMGEARSVHIFSSRTKPGAPPGPAEEIAAFDLKAYSGKEA